MPWVNLHPLYSSRITKSKRWVARKAVITLPSGDIHDPNLHPYYEADDAPLYPWTSSTFPRPRGSPYDEDLKDRVAAKSTLQHRADQAAGDQYGFREGVEPVYGPERPRSNLYRQALAEAGVTTFCVLLHNNNMFPPDRENWQHARPLVYSSVTYNPIVKGAVMESSCGNQLSPAFVARSWRFFTVTVVYKPGRDGTSTIIMVKASSTQTAGSSPSSNSGNKNSPNGQEDNELDEDYGSSSRMSRMRGNTWQRRDGVPILGSRRVRRVLLAAVFPEFYTTKEVDALHSLLDEERTAKSHFFGQTNPVPDQNQMMWRFITGHFESIRWVGSRSLDPFGVSPWWAGGVISGLLNEMPREYKKHATPAVEINWAVKLMTGGEKAPTIVRR
ncbi:hypothetical protein BT69DRAFT_1319592 [Atractiella rhizophila]|nr:hypothetical protein BT69DRAFT_1319592 [Atractiella rhizophila]